jgi:hypothetical protein
MKNVLIMDLAKSTVNSNSTGELKNSIRGTPRL